MTESGSVKVTGIGMPRDADRDSACFATGRGKISFYASPEDLHAADPEDERRTVFTLGAILYHMISGQPPMFGDSLRDALANHADHGIEPLERVRPGVPGAIGELVEKMLQPPPRNTRFAPQASKHHSHTLPLMSERPSSFGCFVATSCTAPPELLLYHATSSTLLLPLYW